MAKNKSGFIIAAAFIGPGTVTTASLAGANFGFHLIWALLFSVFATIVLQDMAARLGVATSQGLADSMKQTTQHPVLRAGLIFLIVGALGVGNAAYESGNLTGAAIGLNAFFDLGNANWALLLGILAALLLWFGHYALIESVLVALVFIMAAVFFVTLFFAKPDFSAMLTQALTPRLDAESITTVLALIGTTIVPYNLFLHASLVANDSRNTDKAQAIIHCRKQSALAIGLGGTVTLIIVATAMTAFFQQSLTMDAGNMGQQLKPVLGDQAQYFFAIGLFSAGLTSAITAPLAASYAVCGALNLPVDIKGRAFRAVWLTIILCGVVVASLGFKPLPAILFAQATNGILLPIVALFLLVVMNTNQALGEYKNKAVSNIAGVLVVITVLLLATYKLMGLLG